MAKPCVAKVLRPMEDCIQTAKRLDREGTLKGQYHELNLCLEVYKIKSKHSFDKLLKNFENYQRAQK
jgi:hypothetical protein